MDVHGPYGAPAPYGGNSRSDVTRLHDGTLGELSKLGYDDYLELDRFRNFEDLVASYDEGIAHVDAEIGRLLDLLRKSGLYDEALVVVTSDHGESLLDHGVWVGHGLFLTDDEIRVPLLVKLPGNLHAGTRVDRMVRLIDVAPTIVGVVGVAARRASRASTWCPPALGRLMRYRGSPSATAAIPARATFATTV